MVTALSAVDIIFCGLPRLFHAICKALHTRVVSRGRLAASPALLKNISGRPVCSLTAYSILLPRQW